MIRGSNDKPNKKPLFYDEDGFLTDDPEREAGVKCKRCGLRLVETAGILSVCKSCMLEMLRQSNPYSVNPGITWDHLRARIIDEDDDNEGGRWDDEEDED